MRSELFLNKMMCSSQYPCENFLKVRGLTLHIILVGGFNPSEKYESQLELLFHIYGKIKFMFQTTNQNM